MPLGRESWLILLAGAATVAVMLVAGPQWSWLRAAAPVALRATPSEVHQQALIRSLLHADVAVDVRMAILRGDDRPRAITVMGVARAPGWPIPVTRDEVYTLAGSGCIMSDADISLADVAERYATAYNRELRRHLSSRGPADQTGESPLRIAAGR